MIDLITLAFFLILIVHSVLLALFDTKVFEYSFVEALKNVYFSEIAAGRYIVVMGAIVGLAASVILDIRIYLSKKNGKNIEGNQFK